MRGGGEAERGESDGSALIRRFLLGAAIGFTAAFLLNILQFLDRDRSSEPLGSLLAQVVMVALGAGLMGLALPFVWGDVCEPVVRRVIGKSTLDTVRRTAKHPLMRTLLVAFAIVWLTQFGLKDGYHIKDRLVPATVTAAVAVLLLLTGVVLWRLAVRDRS